MVLLMGIALVNTSTSTVLEFISYEGSFTATAGPANGMTSVDIGQSETSSTPVGFSLQLTGSGYDRPDFSWNPPAPDSPGDLNMGQTIPSATVTCTGDDISFTVTILPEEDCAAVEISDPCTCLDNATSLTNGQFSETVRVVALSERRGSDLCNQLF